MKCKYCQTEIEQDSVFCPNCGKDLSHQSEHCFKCGATLDEGAEYCTYCGTHQVSTEPQSKQRPQSKPHYGSPQPMRPQIERRKSSGIWWLIPAILLACVAGYLLFFQSSDDKSKKYNDDRYEAVDRDRDSRRDKDDDYKKQENEDSLLLLAKTKSDSLAHIKDSLENAKGKKKTKHEKVKRESSQRYSNNSYQPSGQNSERASVTTGTKNLGYATFKGSLRNGKPHDVSGRLIFKTSHVIDSRDPKGRIADPGDYVIGEFADGHLVQGIWYGSDHHVKGSIIIGS